MYVAPPPQLPAGSRQLSLDGRMEIKRVYQVWKGNNKFCLGGRLIFGPDVRSLLLTIAFIIAPVVLFCSRVAYKLLDKFPHHLGIFVMAIVIIFTIYDLFLLFLTSARDPGIIPRNAVPPETERDYELHTSAEWGSGQTPRTTVPRTRDVFVNGFPVKIKFCDTCLLYRPPRCSHCSICNNCVERFDHHCPWVGQCIGQRNYRYFFMFVFTTTLLCIYVFAFCWVLVKKVMGEHQCNLWRAMGRTPESIILIVYTFIAVWFVGGLTTFHLYLISTNQTTYENFRYRYDSNMNPYNKGLFQNFKEMFFTNMVPSKNNFRAEARQHSKDYGVANLAMDTDIFSTNMGKGGGDLEMGMKATWLPVGIESSEDSEGIDARSSMHPRRSSWGRKSGSWEITPDILALATGVGDDCSRANGLKTPPGNEVKARPEAYE